MSDRLTRVITPQFLQGVSLGFSNRELIADKVSPILPVQKDRGLYRIWGKNEFLINEARWAYGAIPNAIEYRWSSDTYFSEARKLRIKLLDAEVRDADSDLDLRRSYTRVTTNAILTARENRVAQLFTNAANYPGANVITKAGGSEWDTVAASAPKQPVTDIDALCKIIQVAAMVPRNQLTVIIPEPVFDTCIRLNTFLLGALNYTSPASYTPELLAALLGVKQVLIASVMSTGPGPDVVGSDVVAGFTATYLWGDNVWVGLVDDNPNDMMPTFSRTFNWKGDTGGQLRQVRQYRFDDEGAEADWIEVKENMGEKIVFSGAGGVVKNCLSYI